MYDKQMDLPGFVNNLKGDENDVTYDLTALRFFERTTSRYIISMYNVLVEYQKRTGDKHMLNVIPQFNKRGNKKLKFTILTSTIKNPDVLFLLLTGVSRKTPKIVNIDEYTMIELF